MTSFSDDEILKLQKEKEKRERIELEKKVRRILCQKGYRA